MYSLLCNSKLTAKRFLYLPKPWIIKVIQQIDKNDLILYYDWCSILMLNDLMIKFDALLLEMSFRCFLVIDGWVAINGIQNVLLTG